MKRNHGDKELSELQAIRAENKRLKKQINSLRKQLSRIDIDRYSNLKELIEKHYQEEEQIKKEDLLENLKNIWKCRKCNTGHLEIIKYNKLDTVWYYRICNNCPNRTRAKKYTDDVKGIIKNEKSKTQ